MGKSERPDVSDGVAHVAQRQTACAGRATTDRTVIVHAPKTPTVDVVAIYARVSSADQKADPARHLDALPNLLLGNG
jgi:predicted site-specific integrase-resolvase